MRLGFRVLEAAIGFAFLAAVVHHVYNLDFKPLAALTLPILAVYFGFASLLYGRGRALTKGKWPARSLYAAERTVQATIWHLCGIALGTALYGMLMDFDFGFDPASPSPAGLWLLVFAAPYALMQVGLLCFLQAVWTVAPQFLRKISVAEMRQRV